MRGGLLGARQRDARMARSGGRCARPAADREGGGEDAHASCRERCGARCRAAYRGEHNQGGDGAGGVNSMPAVIAPASPAALPAVLAKSRIRVPANSVPSDAALNVPVREADRGKGAMTGELSDAAERAIAERLHCDLAALEAAYRPQIEP